MTATALAIVTYAPSPDIDMRYGDLKVESLKDHELLVELVATGICHSELPMAGSPEGKLGSRYPLVLGHEGAGHVRANVTAAMVGDVLLSYDYCGKCEFCSSGHTTVSRGRWLRLNMIGDSGDSFATADIQRPLIDKILWAVKLFFSKRHPEDIVVVTGLGAVVMGAVMAGNNPQCKCIIAVDRVQSRLDLAKTLGATHVLNSTGQNGISSKVKELAQN
jgi:Zn-dependent alcohol dehydrogenase